jgi:Tfp pilus assembly protein PilF
MRAAEQIRSPRRRGWSAAVLCIGAALALLACAGSTANTPGGDPVRMSESEYDIARDMWLRQNNPREALGHALKAVELDEDNADAAHLAALIYLSFCTGNQQDCRLAEAERHARAALAARADYREAKNTLAVVLIHLQRYAEAIALLKPLTQDILYQTPENAWGNLGWAYLEQGALDRAVDALQRSVAAQPLFCVGNYRLGVAHERKRQYELALEALTRALETEDTRCRGLQDAYGARARVLVQLGRTEPARADLERCMALDRRTPAAKECASMVRKLK